MKTTTPHVLFNQPISRRTYTWLLFLCPFAAAWIYLSARSRPAALAEEVS
jgi:hypothetical protein